MKFTLCVNNSCFSKVHPHIFDQAPYLEKVRIFFCNYGEAQSLPQLGKTIGSDLVFSSDPGGN